MFVCFTLYKTIHSFRKANTISIDWFLKGTRRVWSSKTVVAFAGQWTSSTCQYLILVFLYILIFHDLDSFMTSVITFKSSGIAFCDNRLTNNFVFQLNITLFCWLSPNVALIIYVYIQFGFSDGISVSYLLSWNWKYIGAGEIGEAGFCFLQELSTLRTGHIYSFKSLITVLYWMMKPGPGRLKWRSCIDSYDQTMKYLVEPSSQREDLYLWSDEPL